MTSPALEDDAASALLRPAGPWQAYHRMLAAIDDGRLTERLPATSALAALLTIPPTDVTAARYLLAADDHLRVVSQNNTRITWAVGEPRPGDPRNEIVAAIRGIREDKNRAGDDPRRLDVYEAAPRRQELAGRYQVTEHAARTAAELEYPGLPYGTLVIPDDAFAGVDMAGSRPGAVLPDLIRQLREVVATRMPRERLPTVADLSRSLRVDPQQVTRAYAALAHEGLCVAVDGGTGTFVAYRPPAVDRPPALRANRHQLRVLLAQAHAAGEIPLGATLPPPSALATRWRASHGMEFDSRQVTRTLADLVKEGSVRRSEGGRSPMWTLAAVPARPPRRKSPRADGPDYAVWDVADAIEGRIRSGEYTEGYRLPPDTELAEEFDLAPDTCQDAMQVLAADGLVAVVRGRETDNPTRLGQGRYVAAPGVPSHTEHLAIVRATERLMADLRAGAFAGEIPCDPDSVWPPVNWLAPRYGVSTEALRLAYIVLGRRGYGANIRRGERYEVPLAAFDPGDGPPSIKNPEWVGKGGRPAWVESVVDAGLEGYPHKGLRLPSGKVLAAHLGTSTDTLRQGMGRLGDRLVTRRFQGGGVFTNTGTPTTPAELPGQQGVTAAPPVVVAVEHRAWAPAKNVQRSRSTVPAGWEGTALTWVTDVDARTRAEAKRALLLASATGELDGEMLRSDAELARLGITQALVDASRGSSRKPRTRAQFRVEARQVLAILDAVAPHLGDDFSDATLESWLGSGGIRYALNCRPPMSPGAERAFLTELYSSMEDAFAGPVDFVDTRTDKARGPERIPGPATQPSLRTRLSSARPRRG